MRGRRQPVRGRRQPVRASEGGYRLSCFSCLRAATRAGVGDCGRSDAVCDCVCARPSLVCARPLPCRRCWSLLRSTEHRASHTFPSCGIRGLAAEQPRGVCRWGRRANCRAAPGGVCRWGRRASRRAAPGGACRWGGGLAAEQRRGECAGVSLTMEVGVHLFDLGLLLQYLF